jgi:hypothetical protein
MARPAVHPNRRPNPFIPMRSSLLIALAALIGLAIPVFATAAPTVDETRARIRVLEQRVIDASAGIPVARRAEARAAARRADANARLASVRASLGRRTATHRAGQTILARRLRDLYRMDDRDPLVTALISGDGLSALASDRAGEERAAHADAALVARLRDARRDLARLARTRARDVAAAEDARAEAALHRVELERLTTTRARALREARRTLAQLEARERRATTRRARRAPQVIAPGATTSGSPRRGRWPAVPGGPSPAVLDRIAQCESGGNPRAIGGGGTFRGKYQFMQSTWEAMGGRGDPAQATEAEQDHRAAVLFVRWGAGQWPVCAAFAR